MIFNALEISFINLNFLCTVVSLNLNLTLISVNVKYINS